jgi:catechol 2,3-dioxygenase-like lactoylglutathione lyase family enzyme
MFDHVKFGVSNYAASKAFFLKALGPLGVAVVGEERRRTVWSSVQRMVRHHCARTKPAPLHLAFTADNRQQVQAFHHAAPEAAGTMVRRVCEATSCRSSSLR